MSAEYKTKRRGQKGVKDLGQFYSQFPGSIFRPGTKVYFSEYDIQETSSQGHKGPPFKEGGEFVTARRYLIREKINTTYLWNKPYPNGGKYDGLSVLQCNEFPRDSIQVDPGNITDDSLPYGPVGWNKFKPGRPGVQLGQDVLELGQIPKTIFDLKDRIRSLRDLAHKHIAWEFGAAPLIQDLRYIYHLQKNLQKRLEQLARDNGRPVRRSGLIAMKETTGVTRDVPGAFIYPGLYTPQWGAIQRTNSTDTGNFTTAKYRFAARFRYWVPDIGESRWTRKAEAALLGLNPSLSLLYQVTPWSWLIDWFSNVGDVIDNLSYNAAENLVADYAFVMGEYVQHRTLTATAHHSSGKELTARIHIGRTLKVRHPATPFGFGLTINTLSGRQMAILSSLGLIKSKFG